MIENHGLMKVSESHMINRYNEALYKLCGFKTRLSEFYIDCSGFSPQIANEIDDHDYLNVHGSNKTFIIISTSQKDLGMYNNHFSSNKFVIHGFIESNFKAILALTSIDVVYGEIENNVLKIESIQDVISSNKVTVYIDTPKKLIKKSDKLLELIDKVNNNEGYLWSSDDDINEIIKLSKVVGDVRRNPIVIKDNKYKKRAFYTSHFGGMYVFYSSDDEVNTIIYEDKEIIQEQDIPNEVKLIDASDKVSVFEFLTSHNLVSPVNIEDLRSQLKFINEQKKLILLDSMVESGEYSYNDEIDEYDMKSFIKKNIDNLPAIFNEFYELANKIKSGKVIDSIDEDIIFYLCRPGGVDKGNALNITEQIIARQTPYHYQKSFLNNRSEFWKNYKTWSPEKQTHVRELVSASL